MATPVAATIAGAATSALPPTTSTVAPPTTICAPPPTLAARRSTFRLFDVLATAALAGCVVAICVRLASLEERLERVETSQMLRPRAFRPLPEDDEAGDDDHRHHEQGRAHQDADDASDAEAGGADDASDAEEGGADDASDADEGDDVAENQERGNDADAESDEDEEAPP